MERLEFENTYHIFNRVNGAEKIFLKEENYRFFLKKFKVYIHPIAETLAYCLMPNHFHLLLRMRSESEVRQAFPKFQTLEKLPNAILSKRFANFFSSYTQSFNKSYVRKGSLFMKNFKRKKITDSSYLLKLIHYVHYNPVEAGLSEILENWKYSSYCALVSQQPTLLQKREVVELFGDLENFKYCHKVPPKISGVE